jgi:drug/metabolite transporter (DMT)-like permease
MGAALDWARNSALTSLAILLALASAVLYGAADFLGGFATKRASTFSVLVLSQLVSVATVLAALCVFPPASVHGADLAWGAIAGLVGGAGLVLFYRGLAMGTMSIFAPITGVAAIAVPVLVGLFDGERPRTTPLVGILLAAVSVVCVSVAVAPRAAEARISIRAAISGRELVTALAAGSAFGCFYVAIKHAAPTAGLWPLAAARGMSVAAFATIAVGSGRTMRAPRAVLPIIMWTGFIDMLANICFLLALDRGMLSVVGTLASLYPAATVVLARIVLRERLGPVQGLGLGLAAVAVAMMSLG